IVFEGVVEDCSFENCSFSKVTFQNTTLINTFFKGRNLKRITFINCKADRLTYEFLRTNKAVLDDVTVIN
ncbi:MAG TPA: pentapeptide repeat-containing protein, partial [Bacteroidales bacterium]|nr:pentapeptide repeat-containing protein [Bacteroidales bacterium]